MEVCEVARVRQLVIDLQTWQKMKVCPRLPTVENFENELTHYDMDTGEIFPNNLGTFTAVAIDESKKDLSGNQYIVGYIMYSNSFSIIDGGHFWLNSFFIEQEYRKQGLGKKLMDFVRIHALASGFTRLDVPVMNDNINGLKFYAKYSAKLVNEEYHIMSKKIDSSQ